jgi:hypothetical protein
LSETLQVGLRLPDWYGDAHLLKMGAQIHVLNKVDIFPKKEKYAQFREGKNKNCSFFFLHFCVFICDGEFNTFSIKIKLH